MREEAHVESRAARSGGSSGSVYCSRPGPQPFVTLRAHRHTAERTARAALSFIKRKADERLLT